MFRRAMALVLLGLVVGCEDFNEAMDPNADAPTRDVGGRLAPITGDLDDLAAPRTQPTGGGTTITPEASGDPDPAPVDESATPPVDPPNGEPQPTPIRRGLPDLPIPGRRGAAVNPGNSAPVVVNPAPTPPAGPAAGPRLVRLSTGVSLPQTLPTGTAMTFSVEYRFLTNPPGGSTRFALVIRDGRGRTIAQPVAAGKTSGTITAFATTWKPEQKPFQAVMVMAGGGSQPSAVSNVVDLR